MDISIEECLEKYWKFIMDLRNDKRVLSGFIESKEITWDIQQIYMKKNAKHFRVATVGKTPAGYVGVIDDDIRVCTHPNFQGKGIAKFMINECMKIWPTAYAKVKIENIASSKLFLSCGFVIFKNDEQFNYYKKI